MAEPDNDIGSGWTVTDIIIRAVGVVYILLGLPFFFFFTTTLGMTRSIDWSNLFHLFLVLLTLGVMPLLLITGIGLVAKRRWARPMSLVPPIVAMVGAGAAFIQTPNIESGILLVVCTVPALMVAVIAGNPFVARQFESKSDSPKQFAKTVSIYASVAIAALVALGVILAEVPVIGDELRLTGWERECEAGDYDACGQRALTLLRKGDGPQEWSDGLNGLGEVCEADYSLACRRYGYAHGYIDRNSLGKTARKLYRRAADRMLEACVEGKGRACFAAHFTSGGRRDLYSEDQLGAISESAQEACQTGDEWACRTHLSFHRAGQVEMGREEIVTLCRAGFTVACGELLAKPEDAEEAPEDDEAPRADVVDDAQLSAVAEHCLADPSAAICPRLVDELPAEDGAALAVAACDAGLLASCAKAAESPPVDSPHRDAVVSVYEAMASASEEHLARDVGFWSVPPPKHTRLAAACQQGEAVACFGYGLQISESERGKLEPTLDRPRYESSFGRACELGMNAGCLAMGERLRNRPIGEEIDFAAAGDWYSKACERGHQTACWLIPRGDALRQGVPDDYEETLVEACKASSMETSYRTACRELAYFWADELGATPWLLSERRAHALVRPVCTEMDDGYACSWYGWARTLREEEPLASAAMPWHVEKFTALQKACKKRNTWACEAMLEYADSGYPAVSAKTVEDLRTRVCGVFPDLDRCRERQK